MDTRVFAASANLETWHQCMGHLSYETVKAIHNAEPLSVYGFKLDGLQKEDTPCHGCQLGKIHRLPFPPSSKHAEVPLEIVHSDLVGPFQTNSIQGNKYFATFIDDYSKIAVITYMKSKDQFKQAFINYKAWAENQLSHTIKCLHLDRGGEYVNNDLKHILQEAGVEHKLTVPHSPQQNGRAERFNHTIMEKASAMLHHAGMSQGFWETAVATACHLYNRTPTRSNKWRTPLELWNGTIPDVSYYKVYGCKAYYHVPDHNRRKLDPKAREAVFVGYEPHSKGYTLWDSHSRSFISSRDVTFDEKTFPSRPAVGTQAPSISNSSLSIPNSNDTLGIPFVFDAAPGTPPPPPPAPARVVPPAPRNQRGAPGPQAPQGNPDDDSEPHTPPKKTEPVPDQTVYQTPPSQPPATSPPARRQNVRRWQQRRPNNINSVPPPVFSPPPLERNTNRDSPVELPAMPSPPRHTTRARHPNPRFYNEDNVEFVQGSSKLGVAQLLAAAEIPGYREPFMYKEAMGSNQADEWTDVMFLLDVCLTWT
jgi:transposase InsO family protein